MQSPNAASLPVLVVHSPLSTEEAMALHSSIEALIRQVQEYLPDPFFDLQMHPVLSPVGVLAGSGSVRDAMNVARQCIYAIVECSQFDEHIATVLGAISSLHIPALTLIRHPAKDGAIGLLPRPV